jgi:dolichol-phosphate mannosyltransferase
VIDLSIILPSLNEADNLRSILPSVRRHAMTCTPAFEIIVSEGNPQAETFELCKQMGVKCILQSSKGFGGAIRDGIAAAAGEWVLTMDADGSHDPAYIPVLWQRRGGSDLVVASRYIPGGFAGFTSCRVLLSRLLNRLARTLLDVPVWDLSGGFKLYRRSMFDEFKLTCDDFNVQTEAVVKSYAFGFSIREVPYHFKDRQKGQSKAHVWTYGWSFITAIGRLYRQRNTVYFADYDERAFRSRFLPQRIWHRRRFTLASRMMEDVGPSLHLGCGTSRLIYAHPDHIGIDSDLRKIRFVRQGHFPALVGDARHLPLAAGSLRQVVCLEVVEHVRDPDAILNEVNRVLADNGILVLSTPDYGKSSLWPPIERIYAACMPGAYADQHFYHYTEESLRQQLAQAGFRVVAVDRMFRSILHVKAVKTPG